MAYYFEVAFKNVLPLSTSTEVLLIFFVLNKLNFMILGANTCFKWRCHSYSLRHFSVFNPNKPGLFEGSFFSGVHGGGVPLSNFKKK